MANKTTIVKGLSSCQVNLVSCNVKSLNHPVKRKKVLMHLNKLNTNIAFLQETHLRTADHCRLNGGWIGQSYHSNFGSKSRGTAILIHKNIPFVMSQVIADSLGRYIIVLGKLYETPVILANVYAPNWDDHAFFSNFFSLLPNMNTHHLILAGDFNCCFSTLDRSSSNPLTTSKAVQTIQLLLQSYGICDIWRFLNPNSRSYSFYSPVHKSYSRIDYFFIDKNLISLVNHCEYNSIVISDHAPLSLMLQMPVSQALYHPWRLNSQWLADDKFVEFISSEIQFFLKQNRTPNMSNLIIWEALKAYIRGQIISFCSQKKKMHQEKINKLSEDIFNLDVIIANNPLQDLIKQRALLQTEFNLLSTKDTVNLLNKSRHKTYEHGEKIGRILAQQIRQKTASQCIPEINDETKIKSTNHSQINNTFYKFYSSLYKSESLKDLNLFKSFFDKLNIPTVDVQVASNLDKPFTEAELLIAVQSMQNGKSPGPDGFPSEFFKKFSKELCPFLLSVYQESFEKDTLPQTMRQATISLILKKDKPSLECGSYRPISLLNVDNKILAKMLAKRLEAVMPTLVSDDQTGFIKNRQLSSNVRRLLNVLYNHTQPKISEVVIAFDAEKAFDRVEWDYLFYSLNRFGFGPKFIHWIEILYSCPVAAVRTNNNVSKFFNLQRGTRQGCPLSPLLFALSIEPLAIALRGNTKIKGIIRNGIENKVSLYADDMLLYLTDPGSSLPEALGLLKTFGQISGYKINIQKSELMPINATFQLDSLHSLSFPIKISLHKIKYLGIWVTQRFEDLYDANFNPLLHSLKKDLERWSLLPLSLGGRINIVKMNIMPRLLFLFQCIPFYLTKSFFSSVNKLIICFIWNKKTPRIKKETLQRHRQYGGLALPNFQFYYWSANIKNILYWINLPQGNCGPKWLQLEHASCSPVSLQALACSKLPLSEPLSSYCNNPVVKHTFKIWSQFRRAFTLKEMFKNAPLVRNNLFKPSVVDNAFEIWANCGVKMVKDLYLDGTFVTFDHLVNQCGIPRTHFFRYLQLRSFVLSQFDNFPSLPADSLFDKINKITPWSKETIGKIYTLISLDNIKPLNILKSKWEEELDVEISEELWQEAIDGIHTSSICQRHRVIQFKVVHRLHWSKVKLSQFQPNTDDLCDRCRMESGTLSHMFWRCSKLSEYWNLIFKFFSKVFKNNIVPSPIPVIFGMVPSRLHLSSASKTIIAFGTLLARRLILRKWKDKSPPTFKHWINDLMHHLTLEQIRYSIQGNNEKFTEIWRPVIGAIEEMNSNDII